MNKIKLTIKQEKELRNEIFYLYPELYNYIIDEIESYNYSSNNLNTLSNDEIFYEFLSMINKVDYSLFTELDFLSSKLFDEFKYFKLSIKELETYSMIISYLKIRNKSLYNRLLKIKKDFNLISLITIMNIMSKCFIAI